MNNIKQNSSKITELKQIGENVDNAIKVINELKSIQVDNFSTDELKNNIIPILDDAKKRIIELEEIYSAIDSVQKSIIKPVNRLIKNASKHSNFLGIFGLIIGIIGFLLTIKSYDNNYITISQGDNGSLVLSGPFKDNIKYKNDNLNDHSKEIFYIITTFIVAALWVTGIFFKNRFNKNMKIIHKVDNNDSKEHIPADVRKRTWMIPFLSETKRIHNVKFIASKNDQVYFFISDITINSITIDGNLNNDDINKKYHIKSTLKFCTSGSINTFEIKFH